MLLTFTLLVWAAGGGWYWRVYALALAESAYHEYPRTFGDGHRYTAALGGLLLALVWPFTAPIFHARYLVRRAVVPRSERLAAIRAEVDRHKPQIAQLRERVNQLARQNAGTSVPTTEKENHPVANKTIEIQGVWLIKDTAHLGNKLAVLVQTADGTYHEAITDVADDGPISHYVHPAGILAAPVREFVQEH